MTSGSLVLDDIKYVPEDVFPAIKNYRIFSKDIFVSVAGTLGIVGKVPTELDGANLTENADKITDISCDRDFLLYNLMSDRIQGIIESVKTVGAQPKLALGQIEKFKIAVPPTVVEQQIIAKILSDLDELINGLDKLIVKKRDLKQASMQQLLTGKRRLPGFERTPGYKQTGAGVIPKDWDSRPLGELGYWKGGTTPSMQNSRYWLKGTVPWVSSGDVKARLISDTPMKITDSAVKEASATLLPPNSIIVVTRSGILRKYLPVAKNSALSDYLLHVLICSGPRILATCLKSGTTVESIEFPCLKAFHIPLPPNKTEQEGIATALSDMDAEIAALEQRRDKTRALKQGMMQELLTGKIRLV
jgi:type I restriction enzyme S subunit